MSGAIADADVVSESPPGIGAWGEGLVDRSLASLWYPADWDEVSEDELAFLLPALGAWRPGLAAATEASHGGPVPYLRQVLKSRALAAAALISSKSRRSPATQPRQALEELLARGILTTIALDDFEPALTESAAAGPPPRKRKSRPSPDQPGSLPNWLAVEVTALAHLDRLLRDAQGATGQDGTPLVDWPLSLADVIVATVNARLNGGYVHPAYAHAHELLTAAALLGHLVHGRAAYIPPQLAHCLVDLLSRDEKTAAREDDWCASVLRTYADLAGGRRRTLALAKRAAASGRPYLASPRRPIIPKDVGRATWNARLFLKIAERWQL
jgi:hypothetical protein